MEDSKDVNVNFEKSKFGFRYVAVTLINYVKHERLFIVVAFDSMMYSECFVAQLMLSSALFQLSQWDG